MTPELVIFDCDGVLVDSETISARVLEAMLSELGLHQEEGQAEERYRGRSLKDCLSLIEEELGRKTPANFLRLLNTRTYEAFRGELKAIEGVSTAILEIQRRGVLTCVASSGSHEKIRLSLDLTGLLALFAGTCFSASEVSRGKPAPDLFLHAAAQMRVNIERAVVIEDSLPGIQAGLASNARVLAYLPAVQGTAPNPRICEPGAEIFQSMEQLPELLFPE